MNRLYRNQEVKDITYIFIMFQVFLLIVVYYIVTININKLNADNIRYNKVLAARLITLEPKLKDEIIISFTNKVSDEDINNSDIVLNEYGYRSTLDAYKNPVISKFKNNLMTQMLVFLFVMLCLFYFLIIKNLSKIFLKIKEFSKAAEEIVEGKYNRKLSVNKEGDFFILGSQFDIMTLRLSESLNKLREDKVFLKSIIADISHQLKTPLSALFLYNGVMENDETLKLEERNDLIKSSAEQLYRMDWLCKNLLKLARLEAGAIEFKIKSNLLNDTIEKSLSSLLIKAQQKKQQVLVKVSKAMKFNHDSEWLAEALANIIKNAIEHTQISGCIVISADETPLSVQISIKDNGQGISQKDIGKIFNRFYKGENSTNPASIGIGLALSKTIIEGQHGTISVKSKEGKGTEFNITFLKTVI